MENRILIVDDEEVICKILAIGLSGEGYSCVTAHNGEEALHHFYNDSFSLILSDIKMPKMDGLELLKNVKAVNPKTMVIIMTGFPENDMAVEAIHLGAHDFLVKPIDLDLLLLSVKNALEKKRLEGEVESYHILKKDHLDLVKILAKAIDAKDPYTRGHSERVRRISMEMGNKLGLGEKRVEGLEHGALFHDIGMISIKDEVLQKPGPLSSEEYQSIQKHPLIAEEIIEGVDFFNGKISMIRHHHEHFNGCGYPDGLVGEAIPLEARIISVSDAFDAMTSVRPHRGAMPFEIVLAELERLKGTQFDPQVLEIFMKEKIYKSVTVI